MKTPTVPALLISFPPVIDAHITTLILGSFPGKASLDAGQYYAHKRNQFWRLISEVLHDNINELPYEEKKRRLLSHRIGLWDVLGACEREGSLDSAIRNPQANDFDVLKHRCPKLSLVCFNGKTSGKFEDKFRDGGFTTLVLPSSSPANAQLSFDEKLAQWRGIIALRNTL
jgi:hypoxanthine-DNA glycosylase